MVIVVENKTTAPPTAPLASIIKGVSFSLTIELSIDGSIFRAPNIMTNHTKIKFITTKIKIIIGIKDWVLVKKVILESTTFVK